MNHTYLRKLVLAIVVLLGGLLVACNSGASPSTKTASGGSEVAWTPPPANGTTSGVSDIEVEGQKEGEAKEGEMKTMTDSTVERAIFAAGCFWCIQPPFDKTEGVISTTVGYTGGAKENPTYGEVSSGSTGHTEAILVEFDPAKVSYETLLEIFWKNVDPTTANRQFCDVGSQYRPEVFYTSDAQKVAAEQSKAKAEGNKKVDQPIVVPITKASTFYAAEEYHQEYYKKSPLRYKTYRYGCGRDQRLKQIWG